MRKLVLAVIILAMAVNCWGAYDPTPKTIIYGGWGNSTGRVFEGNLANVFGSNPSPAFDHCFYVDTNNIITKTGKVTSVTVSIYKENANALMTKAVLYLVTRTDATHYVVNTALAVDITAAINAAAASSTSQTLAPITVDWDVTAGMYPAVYLDSDTGNYFTGIFGAGEIGTIAYATNLNNASPAIENDPNNGATVVTTATATGELDVQFAGTTADFLVYSNTNCYAKDAVIPIPTIIDDDYYIIVENFYVPNTEDGVINLDETLLEGSGEGGGGGTNSMLRSITLSHVADATLNTLKAGTTQSCLLPASSIGHKINLHIYIDPVGSRIEVFFCDYDTSPIRHQSAQGRVFQVLGSTNQIRRIRLTQTTGTGATIGSVYVCRKPLVTIGDSIMANIECYLGNTFTKPRYNIKASISGSKLSTIDKDKPSTFERWNGIGTRVSTNGHYYYCMTDHVSGKFPIDLAAHKWKKMGYLYGTIPWETGKTYAAPSGDLAGYRSVVYVFGNGMCINDLIDEVSNTSTPAQMKATVSNLAGYINRMASDAARSDIGYDDQLLGNDDDVILCGMVPTWVGNGNEDPNYVTPRQTVQQLLNNNIRWISQQLGMTYVDVWNYPYGYYEAVGSGRLHPDANGSAWIASKIVEAYEGNLVPTIVCSTPIPGDLNGDYKVDLADFAIMASHWLEECNQP
ncbi:MAG: hypothetical protein ABSB11_11205 [Sedimentisphaerales bacterium]|jgi:hypothetical protein